MKNEEEEPKMRGKRRKVEENRGKFEKNGKIRTKEKLRELSKRK